MWELDYKEGWAPKYWCFWTVVLEKTLESPLDNEIKPVNPKGNQSWLFIRETDSEAEAPILWPPDVKSWLTGKDLDAVKDWRQEEKGTTEDRIVGWYHRFNGHEFEQAPGDGERQGSLACFSLWGRKELDMTERLNNKELVRLSFFSCVLWLSLCLLWRNVHVDLCTIFYLIIWYCTVSCLYVLVINSLWVFLFARIFSILRVLFFSFTDHVICCANAFNIC